MVLTAAEVLVSVTCLEFSYTQAPPKMKSLVMSLYLLSVALGNVLTSGVNWAMKSVEDGGLGFGELLHGERYYWFFAGLMTLAAVVFIPYAAFYREKTYLPD
jgi:POT family proton-dependent oligopeptide transporter